MADKFKYSKKLTTYILKAELLLRNIYIAFKATVVICCFVNLKAWKDRASSRDVNCSFYYLSSTLRIYLHFSLSGT
jgi:hypothetical protein